MSSYSSEPGPTGNQPKHSKENSYQERYPGARSEMKTSLRHKNLRLLDSAKGKVAQHPRMDLLLRLCQNFFYCA